MQIKLVSKNLQLLHLKMNMCPSSGNLSEACLLNITCLMAVFPVGVAENKLSEICIMFKGLFLVGVQSGSQEVLSLCKLFF